MITDRHLTRSEVANLNVLMLNLNEFLTTESKSHVSVDLFIDEIGMGCPRPVRDSNGEILGYLGLGEELNQVVFYLDDGQEDEG
jgi:hypothetical protein